MRQLRFLIPALAALVALASVSVHPRRTYQIADPQGRLLAAYVAYRYDGSRPNFVHPVTYTAVPLTLAAAGGDGRVTLPFRMIAHLPFPIQTHPELFVELVYAPAQHNALGAMAGESTSRAGEFAFDADRRLATVDDLRDRPERWHQTLYELRSLIRELVLNPETGGSRVRARDPRTADLALELMTHFRQEYDAFLARHADAAPPTPGDPTWGALVTRVFGEIVARLPEYEKVLR
jgi:hypothetical protein